MTLLCGLIELLSAHLMGFNSQSRETAPILFILARLAI